MRAIDKGTEPRELRQYRARSEAIYDGPDFTPVKARVRQQLLEEQGFLCAYCMQRIADANVKIEHWHCQASYPAEQLDYGNLLGCCKGNEGHLPSNQHCDTKKGPQDICFNPGNPQHAARMKIRYSASGAIFSDDDLFDQEINNILNLNLPILKRNRKGALKAVMQVLDERPGTRTQRQIRSLIERCQTSNSNGELDEYCDVAVYYLRKRLART